MDSMHAGWWIPSVRGLSCRCLWEGGCASQVKKDQWSRPKKKVVVGKVVMGDAQGGGTFKTIRKFAALTGGEFRPMYPAKNTRTQGRFNPICRNRRMGYKVEMCAAAGKVLDLLWDKRGKIKKSEPKIAGPDGGVLSGREENDTDVFHERSIRGGKV